MASSGWIGIDLDGTLAHYDGWRGPTHIGAPVPAMMARAKAWMAEGTEIRIFTARAFMDDGTAVAAIKDWCMEHGLRDANGNPPAVTNVKDYSMVELWDDRAVQVEVNTGLAYVHPHGKPTP